MCILHILGRHRAAAPGLQKTYSMWRWCIKASCTSPPLRFRSTNSHSLSQSLHGSFTSHPTTLPEVSGQKWSGLTANACPDISGNLLLSWWKSYCGTGCFAELVVTSALHRRSPLSCQSFCLDTSAKMKFFATLCSWKDNSLAKQRTWVLG